ncbi:SMI1/KNR4 family protein [Catellatospora tritici]|uniref:SMI1/KNR4 family protein n=1 Tax=Catellatospora tritici TaxID=2851566 RepID=UPI001C2CD1E4|nr:SMI1/KNR4 family protein [Catellatospora tritici]MBV1851807.1 SMI1/KNR4 family protein [Catellatospora tritici]
MTRFDEIRASFWSDSTHGVQPPLTRELVAQAQTALGVTLPGSLLELLRLRNGGGVARACSAFPVNGATSWCTDEVPFESLLGIGRRAGMLSLFDSPFLASYWGLPRETVLLSSSTGHSWVALDYRPRGPRAEPTVVWFDADFAAELTLAADLRGFLAGLRAPVTDRTVSAALP